MIRNYLKLAWRNMLKHKTDTGINLVGLSVSFTAALLLVLSVWYEFSFDRFHKNASNIYHLYFTSATAQGAEKNSTMPVPLTPALKQEFPEVKYAARYINTGSVVRYKDKKLGKNLKLTDPDFFKMFSFPFLKGDANSALSDLNSVAINERAAKSIFNEEDPLGKTIEVQINGEWKPFTVTAVLADHPDNSSIIYDLVVRFEHEDDYVNNSTRWDNFNHDVYVQLQDGTVAPAFSKKTRAFINKNFDEDIQDMKRDGIAPLSNGSYMQLEFQPLADIHTNPAIGGEGNAISRSYLVLLLTVGCLILLIACINFINLSIGRSFTRTHEIGLRKTLGARRFQLIGQFWSEAFVTCLIALLISSALCYILLPYYRQLFAMNISRELLYSPLIWIGVLLAFILITLIAGGYPAWLMSRFNIIHILKGKLSVRGSQKLRNSLIVVQFSIAILLMICTLVAWQQIDYLRSKPVGYNRNQVISIPVEGDINPTSAIEIMRSKLTAYPSVESVTGIYNNLGRGLDGSSRRSGIGFDFKNRVVSTTWMGVSYDFAKTLDLQIIAGRDFSKQFPTDSNGLLINEAMAEQLGEKDPVGIMVPVRESQPPKQVIGVVKNFNYESLHGKIEPLTMVMEQRFPINYILVKVKPNDLPGSMQLLKNVWKEIAPGQDFKASFLDENVERQYRREEKLGRIFIYGSIIAIILSCMGLLAMVILIVAQRIKEIGIRKVLGASVPSIVAIVSKNFILLVVVSFIIAAPLAWYFMSSWLENFAYRIPIRWWVFAAAGAVAIFIALFTISLQAIKAALANPVKSLRTE